DPDRVSDRLQLRGRLQDVLPGARRLDTHLVEEVPAVVDRVGDEILREPVPLLRLWVVTALEADLADLADLVLHLLDDLAVVDDVVLEPRLRREVSEDVVPAFGRDLRLRPRRQPREA